MTTRAWLGWAGGALLLAALVSGAQWRHAARARDRALDDLAVARDSISHAVAATHRQEHLAAAYRAEAALRLQQSDAALRLAAAARAARARVPVVAPDTTRPPSVADTLAAVRHALALSDAENAQLREAVRLDRLALTASQADADTLRSGLRSAQAALVAAQSALAAASRVVRASEPRCRIAFLPCPSRKLAAAAGSLVTIVVLGGLSR